MSLVEAFFTKDASLEIPVISLKRDSNTEVFPYGFMVTLFKLSKRFLQDIFAKHFLTEVAGFEYIGFDFNGNNVFGKNI